MHRLWYVLDECQRIKLLSFAEAHAGVGPHNPSVHICGQVLAWVCFCWKVGTATSGHKWHTGYRGYELRNKQLVKLLQAPCLIRRTLPPWPPDKGWHWELVLWGTQTSDLGHLSNMGEDRRARGEIAKSPTNIQLTQGVMTSEAGAKNTGSWWSAWPLGASWLRKGVWASSRKQDPEPWAGMCAGMWLARAGAMPHPFCSKGTPSQESGLEGF